MLIFSSLNVIAIVVAAVVAFMIGFLWHGPLFGKYWMKMMGIPQAEVDAAQSKGMGPMLPTMLIAFVQQIVVAVVISVLVQSLNITTISQALLLATLLWVGFIASTLLNSVLWEKRKMDLYLFGIGYHFVLVVAVSLILVSWS